MLVVDSPPTSAGDTRDSGRSLGRDDPLEKEMATHSSILAWRIPQTEEPGLLQSVGLQRVRQLSNWAHMYLFLDRYSAHIGFHVFAEWMNSQPETILQILVAFTAAHYIIVISLYIYYYITWWTFWNWYVFTVPLVSVIRPYTLGNINPFFEKNRID